MGSKQGGAFVPVVTRFFWPPEIPRCILSPTNVFAQISSPRIFTTTCKEIYGFFLLERS
jgi:hypothetical protein